MNLRTTILAIFLALAGLAVGSARAAQEAAPVYIGFDGEYGLKNSTSAQAIERGLSIAIHEINAAGGVLGGRPLVLRTKDNRSVPARGVQNLREFARIPDLVAVIGGRFSPVILQQIELTHRLGLPLIDAWGSADGVTDHAHTPSYTFRLSLRDRYAMPVMLEHARAKGARRVALMVPNTGWGRSNVAAARRHLSTAAEPLLSHVEWYNWGDKDFAEAYQSVLRSGAEALVLVANDREGSRIVHQIASLPEQQRLPVICHWGVTGGQFAEAAQGALERIDFSVVQTFSLYRAPAEARERVMTLAKELYGIETIDQVESPVGFGHAYDIAHILARAVDLAGGTDRAAVRDALERVRDYRGLVRDYAHPFPAKDHNALEISDVFMAVYEGNVIKPLPAADE